MTMNSELAAVVMAGGLGTRMKSETPKHQHGLLGRRVVDWVLDAAAATGSDPLVVVASPETKDAYDEATVAIQEQPLGTGDAVAAARQALDGFAGPVLVLDAAPPLLTPELLRELVEEHRRQDAAVTLLTFEPEFPLPYGRILRDESGAVRAVVEERDATSEEREVRELNTSIYVFDAAALWNALAGLEAANAQDELYLTDTIAHIVVARGAEIGPHVVAWDSTIGLGALVGPFCYLRPGTVLGAHSKAGTFVEVKNSSLGEGAKVPHLSYIGDAEIGDETNIGAGNITANLPPHPGSEKERTKVGRNVKTSIHTSFVAPVEIGDNSWTAAGSVITEDVPPDSLAGFPPRQVTKEGYVRRHRDD